MEDDDTGDIHIHDGHIHMFNPFLILNGENKFAFNGMVPDRAIEIDAYLRTAPMFEDAGGENTTNVYYLSRSIERIRTSWA